MSFEKIQIRLVLIVLAVVTVVLAAIYFTVLRVPFVPAYENIRQGDASAIVTALEGAGVPYRLENDGHDILVPEDRVSEARVVIAGSDVPLGGTVGFELFNDSDMGLTEFAQKINLQRALQGELARTIMSMDGVAFARVHLALPERSIFSAEQGDPTAAVTIQMQPGEDLSPQRIQGIRQLVAFSVPDLQAGAVAILDEKGGLISAVASVDNGFDGPLNERTALEQYYQTRAREAISKAAPGLQFEVSVSTRRPLDAPDDTGVEQRLAPSREQVSLNVLLRTNGELPTDQRDRIETTLADALELDRAKGDSLVFTMGLVEPEVPGTPLPVVAARDELVSTSVAASDDSGAWLFNRSTLIAIVLLGIVALIVRPRRQLDDAEAASFAEMLKSGINERDLADVR